MIFGRKLNFILKVKLLSISPLNMRFQKRFTILQRNEKNIGFDKDVKAYE